MQFPEGRFSDHIPGYASGKSRDTLADRDDGAVLALLRDCVSNRRFVFVGTHLFFNPWWPDVKLLQAHILTQQVQHFLAHHQQAGEQLPLIVAGDFNSLWRKGHSDPFDQVPFGEHLTSGVFDLLSTGSVTPSHSDHPLQRALLRQRPEPAWQEVEFESELPLLHSAYTQHGAQPPLSTKTATFAGNIDYIWLSDGWEVAELLAMPYEAAPGTDAAHLSTFEPMPNDTFPSDHLALGAKLELLAKHEAI